MGKVLQHSTMYLGTLLSLVSTASRRESNSVPYLHDNCCVVLCTAL